MTMESFVFFGEDISKSELVEMYLDVECRNVTVNVTNVTPRQSKIAVNRFSRFRHVAIFKYFCFYFILF